MDTSSLNVPSLILCEVGFIVVQLCLTLCNPMDWSVPGFLVLHSLLEFAQTHIHWVDAIQLSHPLLPPFPLGLNSFPASGFSNESALHIRSGQSIGASASVLPVNQDWSPSEWTGWISLQSKGLSRVFSSTTVQKHQFFGAQPSLWSNSYMFWTCVFYLLMSMYDVLCP